MFVLVLLVSRRLVNGACFLEKCHLCPSDDSLVKRKAKNDDCIEKAIDTRL